MCVVHNGVTDGSVGTRVLVALDMSCTNPNISIMFCVLGFNGPGKTGRAT